MFATAFATAALLLTGWNVLTWRRHDPMNRLARQVLAITLAVIGIVLAELGL